ncbi:MAG: ATP-dependent Clp protease ATP-binding subunit, partial [Bacilli bacterium]
MFGNFTEEARKILVNAKLEMNELKHPYVGSEHLMLAILKDNNNVTKKLKQYNLDYEIFKNKIIETIGVGSKVSQWFLYTPLLKRVMENALVDSKENNGDVTIESLFSNLLEEGEGVAIRIMLSLNIDLDNLYHDFSYKIFNKKKKNKKLLLEELGTDLTKKASNNELDPVIGREKEIKRILEILSRRTKNNPLLIGEAGVGKTAIVEELSRLIENGDVPVNLKNKRIISLDMASTVAGTKYRGEFEDRVRKILKEVEDNDDIILFIDEIHTLVGAGGAEGAIDASNIFKPALARNKLRCIGATTTSEYKKYIEEDKALERRFQKVNIEIPNKETVKQILLQLKPIYESYHNVLVDDKIIDSIISLSEKYIYDRNQPDKAIDILDEVCAKASLKESAELINYNLLVKDLQAIIKNKNTAVINNDFKKASLFKTTEFELMDKINTLELQLCNCLKEVTLNDVANVINAKTKIPVYEILNDGKVLIENIKKEISSQIVGQDEALEEVINIAQKLKLGFKDDNKCYSFMFAGSSGVGKTQLAKIFGKVIAGDNVIKLDMSEYSEAHSISKFVGAPPGYVGYNDNKNILEEIRNKPFSVLILDEIEKAHASIINLLFQILDEGVVKDSKGIEVRFNNVIIVMTSNIGFDEINVGFNKNNDSNTKLKEQFSLPFINRIDNIISFNKLKEVDIKTLIDIKTKALIKKYKNKKIIIKIDDKVVDELIKLSNYKEFGARKIDKLIKVKI